MSDETATLTNGQGSGRLRAGLGERRRAERDPAMLSRVTRGASHSLSLRRRMAAPEVARKLYCRDSTGSMAKREP